jgi:hypothetical protein
MLRSLLRCSLSVCLLAAVSNAQWSGDAAVNFPIADASSDQVQPKIARTPDGGCWISWLDGIATGFDVRIQKLDAQGNEVFPHNGLLVADRGFSSTQDYGLDVDRFGNAVLAYRDDSGTGIQITANKVTPAGALDWGAAGVQVTSTTAFVASPKIAATDAFSGAVIAWTQDNSAHLTALNSMGLWLWDDVLTPVSGSYSPADIQSVGDDSILSYVHQTGGFGSPRRLKAQKHNPAGLRWWGAEGKVVFDTGSLQFGNFPAFTADGNGGAVFSWYDTGSLQLQCYVQRLNTSGTEVFAHNGVAVSTNATRIRVSPSASYDPVSGDTFVFWVEQNSAQSQWGLFGQKLDATGARQWTDEGAALIPVGSTVVGQVNGLADGVGAAVFWESSPSFGNDVLNGAHVSGAGAFDIGPYDVASTPSGKSRLAVELGKLGNALLAWTDDRVDSGDVLGQSVDSDGTLGPPPGFWTDLGFALAGAYGDPTLWAAGSLVVGTPFRLSLGNALESSTAGLFVGLSAINAPFKGGTLVPANDLLVILPTSSTGGLDLGLPAWPPGLPTGLVLHMQAWIVDIAGPVGFSASNAVARTVP